MVEVGCGTGELCVDTLLPCQLPFYFVGQVALRETILRSWYELPSDWLR